MKSLTVCENSLVEPKEKSGIVKDNARNKVYKEYKEKPDAQTVIDDAEEESGKFLTNDNDDDSGADVRDKEDEGSQEEDGTDEEKKCKSVEEMENSVEKISEVMDGGSTIDSKKEVLEEKDLLKAVVNCESSGSPSDGEFPMTQEVVEKRESIETSSKEVKKEDDVLKNNSSEPKSVVVKADEGPGENMSVDEIVEDVKASKNVADEEMMSAAAKESTNESAGSNDLNPDECSSLSNDKREENSMEKAEESEKGSSKDCGKNLRKRLSRPMPKSKKLSLLQEEERQKRMEASNESPEENVSTSKGENDTEMEVETMESDGEANDPKKKEEEIKNEKNENSKTNLKRNAEVNASGREAKRTKDSRNSWKLVKKRQVPSNEENDSKFCKRKKFDKQEEEEEEEEEEVVDEKEMSHNSSPSSSVNENSSSAESKEESGESVSTSEKENSSKDSTNFPSSSSTEETKPKPDETTSSILSNLRGTLKSLTRSDLEELIIQKLCEVITERSTVGKLRRKAQALEQDQEKWKTKVQQLNKQIREMEVVMKKYINEVHKQTKDGVNQVVVPLKVTRSVGLQVSFLSGGSKTQKPNSSQANPSSNGVQSGGVNNSKSNSHPPASLQSQPNVAHPSVQTRSRTGSGPKSGGIAVSVAAIAAPTQRPSYPPVQNAKKSGHAKSDYGPAPPQPLTNKTVSNQVMRGSKVGQASSQAQQQPPQNSSKVIDLTDDDDRQIDRPTIVPLRPQGTMRIVSPPLQSQTSQNSRFTYILPTGGATATGPASGQNLQVLIASPTIPPANGQQIVSMPPLLFKGGNPSQTGPQPVPQLLNPGTRIICPKPLKHPAPLPPQPLNSFQRPNAKLMPPRPALKISKVRTGIVLSWNMTLSPDHAPISSYQLFAYQEGNSPPATSLWKKVGDVKALPLPMACTLTQFMSGHKYHFAVRAVDHHSRIGPFSFPGTIVLVK